LDHFHALLAQVDTLELDRLDVFQLAFQLAKMEEDALNLMSVNVLPDIVVTHAKMVERVLVMLLL